jgi:hypothetical protein
VYLDDTLIFTNSLEEHRLAWARPHARAQALPSAREMQV